MARIRTIKPGFFTSLTIASLTHIQRLTFIGLWTHVDDEGRALADARLVKAALWPLDDDVTVADIERDLDTLTEASLIDQYIVKQRRYLQVNGWAEHQHINRPRPSTLPGPNAEDAEAVTSGNAPAGALMEASLIDHGGNTSGREGKGREGNSCASADAEREFDEWYALYPRKKGKGQAVKAYRTARKTATAEQLLDGLRSQLPALLSKEASFIPYPATWLNGQRWDDEEDAPTTGRPSERADVYAGLQVVRVD